MYIERGTVKATQRKGVNLNPPKENVYKPQRTH